MSLRDRSTSQPTPKVMQAGGNPYQALSQADAGELMAAPISPRKLIAQTFAENRLAVVGLVAIVLMFGFSFLGPLLYHTNQETLVPEIANRPPSHQHPLGTDEVGFDILGRLMVAGQLSLEVGLAVAAIGTGIGMAYGAFSGMIGGAVDAIMMRVLDALFSIPTLFILLILSVIFKPSFALLIVILSMLSWLGPARLVRGETLGLRTRAFVDAARVMGATKSKTAIKHILPNVLGVVIVSASFQVVDAILTLATLSYLGLGLSDQPSWGEMLSDGITNLYNGYWWQVYPAGLALVITVVAFSLVGDALQDSFETRLRAR